MKELNLISVNKLLLWKQHLANGSKADSVYQIANDISGLHATGPTTPYLSLFARSRSFLREHLEDELYTKKRLGRIRCMRGTLYVLTKEMIPVAYAATRRFMQKGLKGFLESRGVSEKEYEGTSKSIIDMLKDQEMTTSKIKQVLGTHVNFSAIVEQMCDEGLLVRSRPRSGWRDRTNNYAVFHEYFPTVDLKKLRESEARAMLVQSYLRSFGPATESDVAWWVGISRGEARQALNSIKDQLEQVDIRELGDGFILLRSDLEHIQGARLPHQRTVNLLPFLDPCLMGYRNRDRYLSSEHRDYVFDRGGNATNTILLDGRVVGLWDLAEDKNVIVKLLLFDNMEEHTMKEVRLEAKRIGLFIAGKPVQIRECDSMIPLTRKTAGGFMSPLKGS